MREKLLGEIQRLTKENGGIPPGAKSFVQLTGIRQNTWRGVFWARWSDAVREAGLTANVANPKLEDDHLLRKLAEAFRHFGKAPTYLELRLYRRTHPDFPHRSMQNRFRSTANMHSRLLEWAEADGTYPDIVAALKQHSAEPEQDTKSGADGFVYLIQWGQNFKIGRGDQLERRVKQVLTGLPDSGKLIHAIRTDDPPGIEAYWHRRFAAKRADNGEWFKLTRTDIAAFKRRKFQ